MVSTQTRPMGQCPRCGTNSFYIVDYMMSAITVIWTCCGHSQELNEDGTVYVPEKFVDGAVVEVTPETNRRRLKEAGTNLRIKRNQLACTWFGMVAVSKLPTDVRSGWVIRPDTLPGFRYYRVAVYHHPLGVERRGIQSVELWPNLPDGISLDTVTAFKRQIYERGNQLIHPLTLAGHGLQWYISPWGETSALLGLG